MSKMTNLDEIWCRGIDDRAAVINGNGQTSSRLSIFAAAQKLSLSIDDKRVAIFCSSSKLQTIAFLAAMRTASSIVLPGTCQVETLKEIQDSFDILLTDEDVSDVIEHIHLNDFQDDGAVEISSLENPVSSDLKVTFFTSGSTGKPKEINKYLRQLDNEVRVWEDLYGAELGSAEVYSTVGHQHIYGLLFRLLWPLCAGRPFRADTATRWEEISQQTDKDRPFILASSPAHLTRLSPLEDDNICIRPILTLSSGGILLNEYAEKAAGYLGHPVLEIYGSTETGGIAKRYNSGADEIWCPLPTVDVSLNEHNCLQVRSSFLPSEDDIFHTEDLVSFTQNGSFVLKGRADRIVKIEGKRVSLPRIEELLRKQAWIEDVFAKMIDGDHPALGAVVVLNQDGAQFLEENGKFRTGRFLREYLKQFEDAVSRPRRWRFVDQIPRNAQGKIRASDIDALFDKSSEKVMSDRQEFTKTDFAEISRDISEDQVSIRFDLPADLDYFKGHFTDTPLLPGVVQVHWAVQNSKQVFDQKGQPEKIEKLKFKQLMFPSTEATLVLRQMKDGKITFVYQSRDTAGGDIEHSSGTLVFEAKHG